MVISCLSEIELDLEFGCLLNNFNWKRINVFRIKLSVVPGVLVELFRIKKHFVRDRPFGKLFDLDIEYVFSCSAVDTANLVFDYLHVVEGPGYKVCSKVHRSGHKDLLSRILHEHIGDDSCKHFSLSRAWRALDQRYSFAACT